MRFLRVLIAMAVLLITGIVFMVSGIKDKVNLSKPRVDISEVAPEELKDGMIVSGTIYEIWDEFAYETGDGVNYSYYAMPLESTFEEDEPVFIALSVGSSTDKNIASKMSKETDDYYLRDITPKVWTELQITGKVKKLKGEALDYFEEYIEDMEYSTTRNMKAFYIQRFSEGSENGKLIAGIVMTVIGLIAVALTVFFRIIKGR